MRCNVSIYADSVTQCDKSHTEKRLSERSVEGQASRSDARYLCSSDSDRSAFERTSYKYASNFAYRREKC